MLEFDTAMGGISHRPQTRRGDSHKASTSRLPAHYIQARSCQGPLRVH